MVRSNTPPITLPIEGGNIILHYDNWNDYGFYTTFVAVLEHQSVTDKVTLGAVRVAYHSQSVNSDQTYDWLTKNGRLAKFFSLGGDADYYRKVYSIPSYKLRKVYLHRMGDLAWAEDLFENVKQLPVVKKSLLRDTSVSVIKGQYQRILRGEAALTNFNFAYHANCFKGETTPQLRFDVKADSTPPTNLHAIIGRNGVGKTTLLNDMVMAITNPENSDSFFFKHHIFPQKIGENYFSRLISVAFSVFDEFRVPPNRTEGSLITSYEYIGLRVPETTEVSPRDMKSKVKIVSELSEAITLITRRQDLKNLWLNAISTLATDENFAELKLEELVDGTSSKLHHAAKETLSPLSSGHAIVLTIITELVLRLEEKTLVLIDEPEAHLHPPLLSALIRALSDLLVNKNGIAILATHSPVVLQEIPKSCVWKINRTGDTTDIIRPTIETFGENVGRLTQEVFRLDTSEAGFHGLLKDAVSSGRSYNQIMARFDNQLGSEAQVLLRSLIAHRDLE